MAMEIFTFDKSLQERLSDYTGILEDSENVVRASRIRSEWSCHVEFTIEPVGWRALWKIPRSTCQDLEIHYPTIVAVEVENVSFDDLTALVRIVAVQDEIHLPEKYDVPLIELYPTRRQENEALDMVGTANCVDQLRFFYNYLWMPWDSDSDDDTDWVVSHLEPRLRLFFDMKRGVIDQETCDVVRSLIREGREIEKKIARLEEDITDEEEISNDVGDPDEERLGALDEGRACQLMRLHFRLQQIKTEMEVLENPAMRNILVKNKSTSGNAKEFKRREARENKREGYFVWLGGSVLEMQNSLSKIINELGKDMFLKTSNCLQEALDCSEAGDIVVLGEGEYQMRGAGGLEEGGTIRGLGSSEETLICAGDFDSGPSLMDFSGGEVTLAGVSLNMGELHVGILVRKGTVSLNRSKIFVTDKSVIKLGIVVLPGAKFVARDTVFRGLGTALVVHTGGEATLTECRFDDCVEGIQLHDDSRLSMTSCELSNFKEYAIRLETRKYVTGTEVKTGKCDLLDVVSEVRADECVYRNNAKGDVALRGQP